MAVIMTSQRVECMHLFVWFVRWTCVYRVGKWHVLCAWKTPTEFVDGWSGVTWSLRDCYCGVMKYLSM